MKHSADVFDLGMLQMNANEAVGVICDSTTVRTYRTTYLNQVEVWLTYLLMLFVLLVDRRCVCADK